MYFCCWSERPWGLGICPTKEMVEILVHELFNTEHEKTSTENVCGDQMDDLTFFFIPPPLENLPPKSWPDCFSVPTGTWEYHCSWPEHRPKPGNASPVVFSIAYFEFALTLTSLHFTVVGNTKSNTRCRVNKMRVLKHEPRFYPDLIYLTLLSLLFIPGNMGPNSTMSDKNKQSTCVLSWLGREVWRTEDWTSWNSNLLIAFEPTAIFLWSGL